jgi:hypothetical protein
MQNVETNSIPPKPSKNVIEPFPYYEIKQGFQTKTAQDEEYSIIKA